FSFTGSWLLTRRLSSPISSATTLQWHALTRTTIRNSLVLPVHFHAGPHPIPSIESNLFSIYFNSSCLSLLQYHFSPNIQTLATRQTPPQNRQLISNDALSVSSTVGNFWAPCSSKATISRFFKVPTRAAVSLPVLAHIDPLRSNQGHAILVGEILRRRSANLHNARAHANSTCGMFFLLVDGG
ncbi:hypothetical protein M431DRAFT_340210, partial [Trichoderma harzianum CBS 226.95]